MEDNRQQEFSPSTLYRYNRAQKNEQLPLYLQFKKEYEVTLITFRILLVKPKPMLSNLFINTASAAATKLDIPSLSIGLAILKYKD